MNVRNVLLSGAVLGAVLVATACGSVTDSLFGDGSDDNNGNGGSSSGGLFGGNGGGDGGAGDGGEKPCTGLCQRQVNCPGGLTTSLTGTVFDPAGKVPLYNVLVYVPNAPVAPITTGASCDRCGNVSGDPLVTALTDAKGQFKLENVPVGKDVPVVVQIGKWRRQFVVPNVAQCQETKVDAASTRMPRNKAEGDLPQMAIASGSADPFECLLVKMGIDKAEFTHDTGNGRVHYYRENGVDTEGSNAPAASTLYNSAAKMKTYDIIFLPCEGSERNKPDTADQNLVDYTAIGGRVFTTHYGYAWLHLGAQPFPTTGNWEPEQSPDHYDTPLPVTINQGFPKGAAFAQWLVNVDASKSLGTMDIIESRHDLNSASDPPSTTWMTTNQMPGPNANATMHITFNTPIGVAEDQQCGRVVYSDFHVSADAKVDKQKFPSSCKPGDLTPQEKALEFMLFDLSSCIQSDKVPPTAPPGGGGVH
jgi:hypothetical protein